MNGRAIPRQRTVVTLSDLLLVHRGLHWRSVEGEGEVARLTKRLLEFRGLRHLV
jgi:hypothetical protein